MSPDNRPPFCHNSEHILIRENACEFVVKKGYSMSTHYSPSSLSRRDFLKLAGVTSVGALFTLSGCGNQSAAEKSLRGAPPAPTGDQAYLAVARGVDPAEITRKALAALGGIERFVKSGQDVIIKPNICVDYHTAEYAVTTNPQVVGSLVTLCLGAGAKRVRVMDNPFGGTPAAAYAISGIEEAVKAAGGEMEIMSGIKFTEFEIPEGKDITSWEVYRDILETDVLINAPIAKHHNLARLTLGGKNLLGTVADPNQIHRNLAQRIADLISLIRPTLTVVDAFRILKAHGPTGGSLEDVEQAGTVIASHDLVAADAYGSTLFGLTGADIPFVKAAAEMGLGTLDLARVKVVEI
jgi:uncharacterized protein (DUF362 family)